MPKFQLYVKEEEDAEYKPKASETSDKEFLVTLAKEQVDIEGNFSAQVVNCETDNVEFWY